MPRAARPCPTVGCPEPMPCPTHKRASAHRRGYDGAHRRLRDYWLPKVSTGQVVCWRCGVRIDPTAGFDLGHDAGRHRGPEHVRCNRQAAGRDAHA